MKGFLFDENLPANISFQPSLPVDHVSTLGKSPSDTAIWNYAQVGDLVIVTKDADFSDRIIASHPPPRIVHLRFGNLRLKDFNVHLSRAWQDVEHLLVTNKLVNVFIDRIEAVD